MPVGENLLHLIRYRLGLAPARTQTTPAEQALLVRLAPGNKMLVEIGVFEGASSLILREQMDDDATLYCIDPFPPGRLGFSQQLWIARREVNRSRVGRVVFLRRWSHEVARSWSEKIDLLFYDAHIDYEGVSRDFADWSQFLSPEGVFLLHTSHSTPNKFVPADAGTIRFVAGLAESHPAFVVTDQVDSITVIRPKGQLRPAVVASPPMGLG